MQSPEFQAIKNRDMENAIHIIQISSVNERKDRFYVLTKEGCSIPASIAYDCTYHTEGSEVQSMSCNTYMDYCIWTSTTTNVPTIQN